MTKLYSKKSETLHRLELKPKKKTISFLLQYSKSLYVIETSQGKIEIILN